MAGTYNHPLASKGRMDDRMMAHVAPGEQIVPKPVLDANPELAMFIAQAIRQAGADPSRYQVGRGMSVNPNTGHPEFGFSIGKIFKSIFNPATLLAPVLDKGPIGSIARAVAPYALNTIFPGAGQILGAINMGSSFFGGGSGNEKQTTPPEAAQAAPFTPTRPDPLARPGSLNEMSAFSPEQERSALATKGINGGLGNDEQAYYKNLIQRSLIGDGNQVNTQNPNFLMPIESSYFSQQGQNTSDIMKFLQGIQG